MTEDHIAYIKVMIDEDPLIPLHRIQMNLKAHGEIRVSIPTIFSAIGAFHYTFKRVIFRPLLGETEEMWINRRTFAGWLLRQHHENKTMFFLDETGFNVSMRSCHGRALRGANAETSIPNIRSRNISVMAVHYEVLQEKCG